MTKKQLLTAFFILALGLSTFEGARFLCSQIGVEYTLMLVAYGSVLLLFYQLLRLIRAMNRYKRAFESINAGRPMHRPRQWNPGAKAPDSLSAIPAAFFGLRTYTWEELILAYAFLGAVVWAFRFLIVTVS